MPDYPYGSVKSITLDLLEYCRRCNWAGHDPYDALNSRLLEILPFLDFKIFRLLFIQAFKRSPVNFRKLVLIPKRQNPKALALFLSASILLFKKGLAEERLIKYFVDRIEALRSPGLHYWCWGYCFPWQTRKLIVPRSAPNLVCTIFVGNALLDAFECGQQKRTLKMAVSAADYIVDNLLWTNGDTIASFSYPSPSSRSLVHNANFLASAFLCRIYRHVGDHKYLKSGLRVTQYSASMQRQDGSWYYGEHSSQKWIDNFHTGFNLCALADIAKYSGIQIIEPVIRKGFDFFLNNFFTSEGAPKYFHNRSYPIDIHSAAQSIITLVKFKNLNKSSLPMAFAVFDWSSKHLMSDRGHFYYQKTELYTNKIDYMRWSQAWMLMALATLLGAVKDADQKRYTI